MMTFRTLLCFALGTAATTLGCSGQAPADPEDDDDADGPVDEEPCLSDADCPFDRCSGTGVCEPESSESEPNGCRYSDAVVCDSGEECDARSGMCVRPGCDEDGDGHQSGECGGDDCDDEDANRYPGNPERCVVDGEADPDLAEHDEDCDLSTLGDDNDADGYFSDLCANPDEDGDLVFGEDCDDENDLRRPGFAEICDGLDNDCKNGLDYLGEDDDGDGFADCKDLEDSAIFDCDDDEAETFPGAEDVCDGVDRDCDGYVEDGDEDGLIGAGATCLPDALPLNDCDDTRDDVGCLKYVDHGSPDCRETCVLNCEPGFVDCDGDPATNGCETNILTSPDNCGECGHSCDLGCHNGTCIQPLKVVAGDHHSCVLLSSGAVSCWGADDLGQHGNLAVSPLQNYPVPVAGLTGGATRVKDIAAGGEHTCAVLTTGAVLCWGRGYEGLGVSSPSQVDYPIQVTGMDGKTDRAVQVAAGLQHSCALLETGAVKCWGRDTLGQLGNDVALSTSHEPVLVEGIDGVAATAVAISASSNHTCAVLSDGAVKCWGRAAAGNLGNGSDEYDVAYPTPVTVSGLDGTGSKAISVATGRAHTCALLDDGGLRCFGRDSEGQVGDNSTDQTDKLTPVGVSGLDGSGDEVIAVTAGASHTCAITDNGALLCWGSDGSGRVGDAGPVGEGAQLVPIQVLGLTGSDPVISVAAGDSHTCALLESGKLLCWGADSQGQLGNGPATEDELEPSDVADLPRAPVFYDIAAGGFGDDRNCGVHESGAVSCWGTTLGLPGRPELVLGLDGIANVAVEVVSGGEHRCARLVTGAVACWGFDANGELGDGSTDGTFQTDPVPVAGIDGVSASAVSLAAGKNHTCAILSTGDAWCWGDNRFLQLGNGTDLESHSPLPVLGLSGGDTHVVRLAAGSSHTCATLSTGEVMCWGADALGQAGDGGAAGSPRSTPALVLGLDGDAAYIRSVAPGAMARQGCALTETGALSCWGNDSHGQVGAPDNAMNVEWSPLSVTGIDGSSQRALAAFAGYEQTCALLDDLSLWCWGSNRDGELGLGEITGSEFAPVPLLGLDGSAALVLDASLGSGGCAIVDTGMVSCWGRSASSGVANLITSPRALLWD